MHNLPVFYVFLKYIISILCEKHEIRVTAMAASVKWPIRIQLRDA